MSPNNYQVVAHIGAAKVTLGPYNGVRQALEAREFFYACGLEHVHIDLLPGEEW